MAIFQNDEAFSLFTDKLFKLILHYSDKVNSSLNILNIMYSNKC